MGGINSGRHNQGGKGTTDHCQSLDVRKFQRENLLRAGQTFNWYWEHDEKNLTTIRIEVKADQIILSYQHKHCGEWLKNNYMIRLDRTPCNYGGARAWLLCPKCGRRIAKLYLDGSGIFNCRQCCNLVYHSQHETEYKRALRLTYQIRKRLKWDDNLLGIGSKPKGMHQRTYSRLLNELRTLHLVFRERTQRRLQIIDASLQSIRACINLFSKNR